MAMVSEFLKQAWFIENEEQEYVQTVKSSKGGPGSAVSPYPTFNPSSDVAALHKAIMVKGVNEDLADSDARALYEAGERRKGTDVNVFNTILTTRSYPQLRRVFQKYTKYSKHDMNKVLDLELKGDIEKCLTAIVKCATSKPAFFAEKLHQAMKGVGTRHKALIRIMVSRSEIDMNDIKAFYQKMYGISLCQAILDETKGDYEKILVALCGGN
uniref:Annexin n=1 Tax=Homo sapiens TaxID=9606 RepID=A0A4D5RAH8_HUMAN